MNITTINRTATTLAAELFATIAIMNGQKHAMDVKIGAAIKARRETIGLTQPQLARGAGVTFQQIQKYEQGRNRVAASRLVMIAQTLRCDISELIDGDNVEVPGSDRLLRAWSRLPFKKREAIADMVEILSLED